MAGSSLGECALLWSFVWLSRVLYTHLFIFIYLFGSGVERWRRWELKKMVGYDYVGIAFRWEEKWTPRSLDSAAGKGYHFKSVRHLCWYTGVRYFLSWISRFFTKPTWYSSLSKSHEFVNRRNFCLCLRFVFGQGHGGVFILRVYLRPTATDVGNYTWFPDVGESSTTEIAFDI